MTTHIGRFAPTPSGPLHQGSLYTALASFLDAKAHQGQWLLRIEDIDPPREQAGATDAIIDCLHQHGLLWDGEILYQSQRTSAYHAALEQLINQGKAYYCQCSRQQLQAYHGEYSGHCRHLLLSKSADCAVRLLTTKELDTSFVDRLQGLQQCPTLPAGHCHDFVIFRRDQLFAYQLAVVVDDITQGVTDIVRGSDILDSSFRQAYLYHYFQAKKPRYLHLPVLNNQQAQKLSKQNKAQAVNPANAKENLLTALYQLNQVLPPAGERHTIADILQWAIRHWQINRLQAVMAIPCTAKPAIE